MFHAADIHKRQVNKFHKSGGFFPKLFTRVNYREEQDETWMKKRTISHAARLAVEHQEIAA
jgi:hypothetical protein